MDWTTLLGNGKGMWSEGNDRRSVHLTVDPKSS